MDKNHPLAHILRKRKFDFYDFDLIALMCYFDGKFGGDIQVEEVRKVCKHLIILAIKESKIS